MKIIYNKQGEALNISKNKDYGFVTVQQDTFVNRNGFFSKSTKTANIRGLVTDLKAMAEAAGGWEKFVLGGKLITIESLNQINANDPSVGLKMAGDTGIVCSFDGAPIYRRTEFTKDPMAQDVLIAHNNVDEIRQANGVVANTAKSLEEYVENAK